MKQKIIIATVLLFTFGASLYAAENTAQTQRETRQIDLTMTAANSTDYWFSRFYLNNKRYNFNEIQRVFDVTDENTRMFFNRAMKACQENNVSNDEENSMVQKAVEYFNKFVSASAENRARVLAVVEKMQREEEQERETKTRERDAHFEKRKNEFIGVKIALGCQFEGPAGHYIGVSSKFDLTIIRVNPIAAMGIRYMRFFGEGNVAHGIIIEGIFGGAFVLSRFHSGINLMYGLKTGQFYAGFGTFAYYTQYRIESFRKSNFEPGLILVLGFELRGLGKSKLQIGLEIKGTPMAITRVSDNERERYLSISLEFGIGY